MTSMWFSTIPPFACKAGNQLLVDCRWYAPGSLSAILFGISNRAVSELPSHLNLIPIDGSIKNKINTKHVYSFGNNHVTQALIALSKEAGDHYYIIHIVRHKLQYNKLAMYIHMSVCMCA